MSDNRHPETGRTVPRVEGGAGRVADALRNDAGLDDLSRARMERAMVQAWSTRGAAQVPLPDGAATDQERRARVRGYWMASLAASAFAGAVLGLLLIDNDPATQVPLGVAQFELRIGDAAVQSGSVAEGQLLQSGQHGRIEVSLRDARLDLARDSRVRFDRISADELSLSISRGRVDVDFHPTRKGEQRMSISSRAARVIVVGTRFSVEVDSLGNTDVVVTEGVVEVWPRSGAPSRRVGAGQSLHVRADDGDDTERAVRDAIESNLRAAQDMDGMEGTEGGSAEADMDLTDLLDDGSIGERASRPVRPSRFVTERRLAEMRALLRHGQHGEARDRLSGLADSPIAPGHKLEALTLIAESYTAQGYIPRAREVYERAVRLAPHHAAAHNAQFALARLLERYTRDEGQAVKAYRKYLKRAPAGALASQAREALCRLGQAAECR